LSRSPIAVLLLLVLLSIASGAGTVMCATDCAGLRHDVQHQHASLAATSAETRAAHHHHHSAVTTTASAAFNTMVAPHCARSAPPAVTPRSLPQTPTLAVVPLPASPSILPARTAVALFARSGAPPPGPPLLPTPLRV